VLGLLDVQDTLEQFERLLVEASHLLDNRIFAMDLAVLHSQNQVPIKLPLMPSATKNISVISFFYISKNKVIERVGLFRF
jgi:hypothetical protein